jgi:hypothetical protein
MRTSTVVKMDSTSGDLVHGSSRAEINAEMNMRQSTVEQDNATILYSSNPEKQDFQHVNRVGTRRVRQNFLVE